MLKELKVLIDIYSIPDKDGNSNLVKKNVIKKKLFKIADIETVEQITNEKGIAMKTMCLIEYKGKQSIIKHRYEDMMNILKKQEDIAIKEIGFKYKNKK